MTPDSPADAHPPEEAAAEAVRLIAFYLPQFHPIPENDEWWGRGFTEWTNVARARPQFRWQHQPHLPADLGFYDLRLPEARDAQADLARQYGISAFCYYHYWFNGRRLLERPFNEVLASGRPDFPFCLCWANENWTRAWDGGDRQILVGQNYSDEDDRLHARALAPALRDPRYLRVDGRPLLLIYRAGLLPDPQRTTAIWREEFDRAGVGPVQLAKVESFPGEATDPAAGGFDAAVDFAPDWKSHLRGSTPSGVGRGLARRLKPVSGAIRRLRHLSRGHRGHLVLDYQAVADASLRRPEPPYLRYPGVSPGFDNTPRRATNALVLRGSTPERYEAWLAEVVRRQSAKPSEQRLIFVNAWNEWAEGNHLEPCARWGRAYLEATRRAQLPLGHAPLDSSSPPADLDTARDRP